MGHIRSSANDFSSRSSSYATAKTNDIFQCTHADPKYLPKNIVLRESRKSDVSPNPTPIMLFSDCTGSMGYLAKEVASQLAPLIKALYNSVVVTDPQIAIGLIGDVMYDDSPLQVTQFESDVSLCDQIEKMYIEGGGGANHFESYDLAWYFAANQTYTEGPKGYIFTIGDEPPMPENQATDARYAFKIKHHFGENALPLSPSKSLELAMDRFNVFHLILDNAGYCRSYPDKVIGDWRQLMGNNALLLNDVNAIGDIVLATMHIQEGLLTVEQACEAFPNDAVKHAFSMIV